MRWRSVFAVLPVAIGLAIAGGGCGSDSKPQTMLRIDAVWNESPATPTDTGYQLNVDVIWLDRTFSCFSLPADLHLTVNEKEAPLMLDGNCGDESLVFFDGFLQNVPITVRLEGGGQVMGEATFDNLFPGAASTLVTPADGQLKPGDPVVVQMAAPSITGVASGNFYWMDPPAGVPPYHTYEAGTLSPDGSTFQTTAPTTTGRAALVVKTISTSMFGTATSCTGFNICTSLPNSDAAGPLFVDVAP